MKCKRRDTFANNGGVPSYTVHSFLNLQFKWYVNPIKPGILSSTEKRDRKHGTIPD